MKIFFPIAESDESDDEEDASATFKKTTPSAGAVDTSKFKVIIHSNAITLS